MGELLTSADRAGLVDALTTIVGKGAVLCAEAELLVYECDGYTIERSEPEIVVLPASTAEVSAILRLLYDRGIPSVARGAGTGLSGGALPVEAPVMISLARMNRILEIDAKNRFAVVEAGVVNQDISRAVAKHGLHYAPDPSSQTACTIGGNVAENSGGPHTLKYGVTTNHVQALEIVLADGEVMRLGSCADDAPGYDLRAAAIGSEGTFGIVTRATVRLVPIADGVRTFLAVFDSVADATRAVTGIIAAGIVPAALEMMDSVITGALEAAYSFGFPQDAGAILIIEIDGLAAAFDAQEARIRSICEAAAVRDLRVAVDDAERALLWKCRKRAFGAVGRISPNYATQDGVVPRTRLPEILERITAIGEQHGLTIGNVFHAGDGNIHPILLYDGRNAEQVTRVLAAGRAILEACVELGGSLTGEHGIGVEKMDLMPSLFAPADLDLMIRVRDVFDPQRRMNPHKIFPAESAGVVANAPSRRAAL